MGEPDLEQLLETCFRAPQPGGCAAAAAVPCQQGQVQKEVTTGLQVPFAKAVISCGPSGARGLQLRLSFSVCPLACAAEFGGLLCTHRESEEPTGASRAAGKTCSGRCGLIPPQSPPWLHGLACDISKRCCSLRRRLPDSGGLASEACTRRTCCSTACLVATVALLLAARARVTPAWLCLTLRNNHCSAGAVERPPCSWEPSLVQACKAAPQNWAAVKELNLSYRNMDIEYILVNNLVLELWYLDLSS